MADMRSSKRDRMKGPGPIRGLEILGAFSMPNGLSSCPQLQYRLRYALTRTLTSLKKRCHLCGDGMACASCGCKARRPPPIELRKSAISFDLAFPSYSAC